MYSRVVPLGMSEPHTRLIIRKAQELILIYKMSDGYYINNAVIHRGNIKQIEGMTLEELSRTK